MNDALELASALAAGLALGAFFFGGLWWSVRKGLASKTPARWFFGGALARMAVVVPGFYLAGNADWRRMALCLAGFFIARLAAVWLARAPARASHFPGKEAGHAP